MKTIPLRYLSLACLAFAASAGCSGEPGGEPQTMGMTGGAPGGSGAPGAGGNATAGTGQMSSGGSAVSGSGGTGIPGTGGAAPGGSSNGGAPGGSGSGNTNGIGPSGVACPNVGSSTTLNSSIVVGSGETYDGECRRFVANPETLGDGSQIEGQDPMFILEDGATLINVVLGFPAADGVHCEGDATLRNIVWEDIGEDALTIEGSGTVTLDGGSATKGADKTFQINAPSTFRVSNFTADQAGKMIRQNGSTTFKIEVFIDHCDVYDMDECIFRTDSGSSTVSMTNTRYHNVGTPFIGVNPGNITESNNDQY